jgi:hypothetical protein
MDNLKDRLQHDLTDAMRAHDEVARETLRMALAAIQRAEVAGKEQIELADDASVWFGAILRPRCNQLNGACQKVLGRTRGVVCAPSRSPHLEFLIGRPPSAEC